MENANHYFDSGYEPNKKQKHEGGGAFATIVIAVVIVLLALMVVGLFWPSLLGRAGDPAMQGEMLTPSPYPEKSAEAPAAPASPTPTVAQEDRRMPSLDGVSPLLPSVDNPIPDIFDAVSPGVVGVINYRQQPLNNKMKLQVYGSGTGFVVSSNGYILTNAHVIEDAEMVAIKMEDGDEIEAKVIGADTETDIAVLKIEKTGLQPLELGDSDTVRVGEYVLAIGNPLDADRLANTITFGIISATAREITIDSYANTYLQTDAAINFGNSGGPLLSMEGKVIGVNSAKTITAGYDAYGNAVNAEGIGFALPINHVKDVMKTLITKGYVERPGIGIMVGTVTEAMAEAEGIPVGAYVDGVVKGGPAEASGLKEGDVIVSANGDAIKQQSELVDMVKQMKIGDELQVRVYREGEYLDRTIVLENKASMDFDNMENSETQN